jgi:hypothetical protein
VDALRLEVLTAENQNLKEELGRLKQQAAAREAEDRQRNAIPLLS